MEYRNYHNISRQVTPPDALDASAKYNNHSNNSDAFQNLLNDLSFDDQVSKSEKIVNIVFKEINEIMHQLPLKVKGSDYDECFRQLTDKVCYLIDWIEKKQCKKTKASLLQLFSSVDVSVYNPLILLIKSSLS